MKKLKSQSAIEFLVLVGFLLFSFTIFFVVVQGNMSDKINERQDLALKAVAITVQDEINLAYQSSDGYSRQFNLPATINGLSYKISIGDGMVWVRTEDGKHAISLPVRDAEVTSIEKGANIIKKEGGVVKLNPVA